LEGKRSESFTLGDTVIFDDLKLCVNRIQTRKTEPYIGVPFLIVVNDPTSVAGNYIDRLGVQWAEEGAGVIVLSIETVDYEKEVDFLAALVTAYRELDLSKKNETADRTIDFIRSQLRSIKDSLRTVEFQLERFGNGSRVKDMSTEAQRLLSKMEGFEIQRSEILIRQNYYSYLDAYLNNGSNLDQIILPSSIGLNDPVLSSLLTQMVSIQLEIKMAADPERINPLVSKKIERMGEIKGDVKEALTSLRSTDKIRLDFLNKQLKENENQMAALPASERQLVSIQRNYALLENLYVFLMQKLSEAGISKAGNTSDIFPVNPPMRGAAISPKPVQNYTLAILLGLMVPFGIFVVLELVDNKIQSKEDIEKMTQIPLIGGVGHNTTGNNLIVSEKPKSSVAESFRALRSNLNYFTGNKTKQVFLVTSSISGEGKTFTTINLATVFALSGKSTLIVGADMRRPKIFEDFNCSNDKGLSTYLSGISDFESCIQSTGIDNLYLVSGGPVPPNPSELLLTAAFETFVAKALERFEFVLIDTPPLALVTDAFVMSKFANHTVFVARQNYTPKEFVKSIDEYYKTGKFTKISILLNDIYKSGLGYGYGQGYAYTYGYSYGYGYSMKKKEGQGYYD
jgi:capsular exopolysaccharide synthesis family protein